MHKKIYQLMVLQPKSSSHLFENQVDKQFVRDWLKANPDSNYDLPQDVIDKTIAKYLEAYELLTGKKL